MKKKILSILLSAAFGLGAVFAGFSATTVQSYAADGDQIDESQRTYVAYQILKGEFEKDANGKETDNFLSPVIGSDFDAEEIFAEYIDEAAYEAKYKVAYDFTDQRAAYEFIRAIEALTDAEKEALAKKILAKVSGGSAVTVSGNTATITGEPGLYLVCETTDLTNYNGSTKMRANLQVVKSNKVIRLAVEKRDTNEVFKEVEDVNDTTGIKFWGTDADYDIGDDVPFRVSGTIADDYTYYTDYYFCLHDTTTEGLTINANSFHVYAADLPDGSNDLDNATLTEISLDKLTTKTIADHAFDIGFDDLNDVAEVTADTDRIVVTYTAKLNEKAIIGSQGNINDVYLEFSNNPDSDGKGRTPKKVAIVFTFKPTVTKVDQDLNALAGAVFTLSKEIKQTDGSMAWEEVKEFKLDENVATQNVFTCKGIDDGHYKLEETTTPPGYNTIDPVEFWVIAEHEDGELKSLGVYSDAEGQDSLMADAQTGDLGVFTVSTTAGTIDNTVINQQGAVLPSTGGIGTTIFYVIGGVLVVGAVVLLIVRRRMRNEEE